MGRHEHADLIHAWAEGAEIQIMKSPEKWRTVKSPSFLSSIEYRIKPKEPEWWENMPKHGVLCWVSDVNESPNSDHPVDIITSSALKTNYGAYWRYATPLTNKEIEAFKR